ncbi:MAG TPA: hypothetical protein DCE39_02470 [Planctomycetaceae bacterium]|nr:hypothetical protein [Planctomycetaceae bacterium]
MDQLGIPLLLAKVPVWGAGVCFVLTVVGGYVASRWCEKQEAFAESHVTMGVLAFAGLIALGSLVPGLFFDLDDGGRFLLGLALGVFALGGWLGIRNVFKGQLLAVMCLLYVAVSVAVFVFQPQWYFGSGAETRAVLLIAATFVVPLSVGHVLAMAMRMEDFSWRIGVVLMTVTLAFWPMAKGVVVQAADKWIHEDAVRKWQDGNDRYKVTPGVVKTLEKQLPGLAVNYSKDGKMADAKPGASEMMRSGEDAAKAKSDEPDEK